MSTVLVTGAGGFIGGAVARLLAVQPGCAVRGGTRDGRLLGDGVAPWRLDVCDAASLAAALDGVDAVVHCAYGDAATTVTGTRLLLGAAEKAGVRRVVYLSSIAVYGAASGEVTETAPLLPAQGRGYAHWKVAAEADCRAASGLEVVILRPAIVYGLGSGQWVDQPARRLLTRRWGDLGDMGRGTANLVHVADVALSAPNVAGEAFNISGDESVTWREWHMRLGAALGLPAPQPVSAARWRWRVGLGLPLRVAAKLVPAMAARLSGLTLLAPSPHEMRLFALSARYSSAKAKALLGWRPAIGLKYGLAESVKQGQGTLPPDPSGSPLLGSMGSKAPWPCSPSLLPSASVVICTFNRPGLFEASLRSCLADATRCGLGFEIIVADNSIAGHAAAIVADLAPGGAAVRVVRVTPPNISLARNAGLRAAAAPLVAFMDDDLELTPGWLDALVAVLAATGADAAIGPVLPRFPHDKAPAWDRQGARFTRTLDVPSGTRLHAGGAERQRGFALSTASSLWRASSCFTDAAPFDPAFGACGGEDLDLFLRLERRGRRFVWCAEAAVQETILPGRMQASYHVLRALSGAQVYAAATVKNAAHPGRTAAGIGLRGVVQAAGYGAAWLVLRALRRPGGERADRLATRAALAACAGWGKVTWRKRVALYHVEQPG